jgi:hypothetical protein
LLIHQIPPKPGYLRSKIGRRLQRLGAVAIKNSVYALPAGDGAREDLSWVLRDVVEGGGDGSMVEASFVEGLSDEQVRELFRAARDAEYEQIAREARSLRKRRPDRQKLARLQKRMAEAAALDFFAARQREPTEGLLQALARRLEPEAAPEATQARTEPRPKGATWVTRTGIHVDRMASAWLIRRFIDPKAKFRFVLPKSYRHRKGELRFDMFDGEYTHQGELCSFEVLLRSFEITDAALRPIAEMIHDVDLKIDTYGHPETAGFEQLINAIALAHREDEVRLARASAMLDDLYELYRRKRPDRPRAEER